MRPPPGYRPWRRPHTGGLDNPLKFSYALETLYLFTDKEVKSTIILAGLNDALPAGHMPIKEEIDILAAQLQPQLGSLSPPNVCLQLSHHSTG